jgi:hypothetical protein
MQDRRRTEDAATGFIQSGALSGRTKCDPHLTRGTPDIAQRDPACATDRAFRQIKALRRSMSHDFQVLGRALVSNEKRQMPHGPQMQIPAGR